MPFLEIAMRVIRALAIVITALLLGCSAVSYAEEGKPVRVLVWSERTEPKKVYPQGINGEIARYLNTLPGIQAKAAYIDEPEQGLTEAALAESDVLIWWGHGRHGDVTDESTQRIVRRVKEGGMGFIALHSAHPSKPFSALMGTSGGIGGWREDGAPEHIQVMAPNHPIARGTKDFTIPKTEMYSEPFDVPTPETVVFHGRWDKGEEFRSGCTWTVGKGRVFYFRPGHESYPIFMDRNVRRIVRNACFWCARREGPGLEALVADGAQVEKIAGGFQFTEGPVWNRKGYLLFSDIPADRIYKWVPGEKPMVFREPSRQSNGLTFDAENALVACEHGSRQLTRTDSKGKTTVLAAEYEGKRLNSPNDLVISRDGSIYFTDPPYGIKKEDIRQPVNGVYRYKDGKLTRLIEDFDMPNGLAFSPDQKTLYIADSSSRCHVRAFDVLPDGTLANGRLFAEPQGDQPGGPDGMKVDVRGNLWTTGPGGVWVYSKEGVLQGVVWTPEVPANLAFGGPDGKTLFITARTGLYRLALKVEGIMP